MGLQFETEEQKDLTLPEDSIHTAKLLEIKPKEINWRDKQTGEAKSSKLLEFWWEVTASGSGDEYVGRRVKGECPAKLTNHPTNKFHNWAEALLGRDIPPGMGLDTDDLVGLKAEISIKHRPDRKSDRVWEEVDEVMPVFEAGQAGVDPPF